MQRMDLIWEQTVGSNEAGVLTESDDQQWEIITEKDGFTVQFDSCCYGKMIYTWASSAHSEKVLTNSLGSCLITGLNKNK